MKGCNASPCAQTSRYFSFIIVCCWVISTHSLAAVIDFVPRINEFHYDNVGVDQGEFVELLLPITWQHHDWQLQLYNGRDGSVYKQFSRRDLLWHFTWFEQQQFGLAWIFIQGIQNGEADGFALVDQTRSIQDFVSYEGRLSATNGSAIGMTSIDTMQQEDHNTQLGRSIQLTGSAPQQWRWQSGMATPGALNIGQTLPVSSDLNVHVDEPTSWLLCLLAICSLILVKPRLSIDRQTQSTYLV